MKFGACLAAAIAALALATAPVDLLASTQKKPAKAVKKASSAKSSKTRPAKAAPTAVANPAPAEPEPETYEPLSDAQLLLASMVQIGRADCEFQQTVLIEPNLRQLGGFLVKFQQASYSMVPEQTTTGAIRLVDEKAGVVWLQIRYKSMLMNTRAGQRMVDACSMPEQRLAEAEAERTLRTAIDNPEPDPTETDAGPAPAKELPLLRN